MPQPSPDPRLAAEPIVLKDKRPPESPGPPRGRANRVRGTGGLMVPRAGCAQGNRTECPAPSAPLPRRAGLSRGCPTYPVRPSFGTAAGAHGQAGSGLGEREGHRPLGGGSERAAVESRWEGTAERCQRGCGHGGGAGWAGGPGDINIQGGQARPVICPDLEHDAQRVSPGALASAGVQSGWVAPAGITPRLPPQLQ